MRKSELAIISIILSFSLIFSIVSCGKAIEKKTESAIEEAIENESGGNVDVDLKDEGAVVKDEKGEEAQIGEDVDLPEGWPGDIPVYPDSKFSVSTKTKNGETDKNEYAVWGIVTKGSVEEVYNWYKEKFSGWELETDQYTKSDDGDLAFLFLTSNGYEISVTIGASNGETSLGMQVLEQ